jgi:hypothetical protein
VAWPSASIALVGFLKAGNIDYNDISIHFLNMRLKNAISSRSLMWLHQYRQPAVCPLEAIILDETVDHVEDVQATGGR